MALEYRVESRLTAAVERLGGACEKHVNTGHRGDPDRLCSFPWGYHCLVETKWETGVRPEAHQLRRHAFWRLRGLDVWVACDDIDIQRICDYAVGTSPVSKIGNPFFMGSSPMYVGGRPRIGEDRDNVKRA
jgi:hypothetical protein